MPPTKKREVHFADARDLSVLSSALKELSATIQSWFHDNEYFLETDDDGRIYVIDDEGGVIGAFGLDASRGEFVYYGVE